jgi:hypothetical protein
MRKLNNLDLCNNYRPEFTQQLVYGKRTNYSKQTRLA